MRATQHTDTQHIQHTMCIDVDQWDEIVFVSNATNMPCDEAECIVWAFHSWSGFRLRSEQEPLSLAGVSDVMEGDVRAGEAISSFFFLFLLKGVVLKERERRWWSENFSERRSRGRSQLSLKEQSKHFEEYAFYFSVFLSRLNEKISPALIFMYGNFGAIARS